MAERGDTVDDDEPVPLLELKDRVTAKTYKLLEAAEAHQKAQTDEEDEAETQANFFNVDEEEEKWTRVQEWCSSTTMPDGFGGYVDTEDPISLENTTDIEENPERCVKVKYILSSVGGGHGDALWAASRGVANQLAGKQSCREILAPLWAFDDTAEENIDNNHPLQGLSFLELGAGGGVPCWTAMWCGAQVVCTDQSIPDRIRCLAESAERNWRSIQKSARENKVNKSILLNAQYAQACPYDWGSPIDEVTSILQDKDDSANTQKLFDVIVAADCVYMPDFHRELIDSIRNLLHPRGVALLPFALHGNTEDTRVWGILEIAQQKGFQVENLGSSQLKPQSHGMEAKRALVHMIRLTHDPLLESET